MTAEGNTKPVAIPPERADLISGIAHRHGLTFQVDDGLPNFRDPKLPRTALAVPAQWLVEWGYEKLEAYIADFASWAFARRSAAA